MDQDLLGQSNEIIALYKLHVPQYVTALGGAMDSGDPQDIAFHAHKLCSAMKSVGKMEIASMLERMQHQDVTIGECHDLFSKVESRINESLVKLAEG